MRIICTKSLSLSLLLFFSLIALPSRVGAEGTAKKEIKVSSSSFTKDSTMPKKFTGDGEDLSPSISWDREGIPKKTRSIAVTCEDPDAPVGTWFHWIVYNIPPEAKGLEENLAKKPVLKDGIKQGSNDFRKIGYNGPAPPRGPIHHYNFKVFALKDKLSLKPGCDKKQFYRAIEGKILGQGKITGVYQRH